MRPFAYASPSSLDEVLAQMGPSARPLAGGTDLVTLMQADLAAPERVLSVSRLLPRGIEPAAGKLRLGAGATLADIANDAHVRRRYTALAQAAEQAASTQLRNMATLGGNLLQRPRCWYFRNPRFPCWLKGGSQCFARDGENRRHAMFLDSPCVAVHPSDLAPALLAFDATLRLRGPQGEMSLPLADFFTLPTENHRSENRLGENQLILAVDLPAQPEQTHSVYLKAMDRAAFSFALVSIAAVLRLSEDKRVGHTRLVLGGVAPIPRRADAAERLLIGQRCSEPAMTAAADAAVQGATPLQHNAWKVSLARTLVKRALETLQRP